VLFLAAGVLVARRRVFALICAASALALSMIILGSGLEVGRLFFLQSVSPSILPEATANAIYDQVVFAMKDTTLVVGVLAGIVAVVAWFTGPFRIPRKLRGLAFSATASLRFQHSARVPPAE
jgi:hypothetical protein